MNDDRQIAAEGGFGGSKEPRIIWGSRSLMVIRIFLREME